jgi:hypothetical protein
VRATRLVAEGKQPDHPRDDDRSREAWRLYRDLNDGGDEARQALLEATPLGEAHAFYATADPLKQAELEARLLARQTDAEIAARVGLSAAAVAAYHDTYYCVRDRLGAEHYVINVCIGEKVHTGLTEGDSGLLLKLLGFLRGPAVLDQLLDYFADPPHLPDDLGRLTPESFEALAVKLRLRVLIVSLTAPGDARYLRTYAAIKDLLEQLRVAERLRGEPPQAFRLQLDGVVRAWRELERLQARGGQPPAGDGSASGGDVAA